MAEFYSLEDAARFLGISVDELKLKIQHHELGSVRPFKDGGSWRFRKSDLEDYQRRTTLGSDPDLSLSDLDLDVPPDSDVDLSDFQLDAVPTAGRGERDVLLDDVSVPPEITGSSSTIIGMKPAGKQPSDSDVKLVPHDVGHSASDSDVRLAAPPIRTPDADKTLVSDDTGDLPTYRGSSGRAPAQPGGIDPGETTLRPSPLLGSSGELPVAPDDSDSDFELTPSSVLDALQPESGSDFELTSLDASDAELDSDRAPRSPGDSDVTGAAAIASGVNLGRPADSGINLLQGGFDAGSAESIELAPINEGRGRAPEAPRGRPAPDPRKDDPSATSLPVRSGGEKDIFDDTDFEVDAVDSNRDDRTVQVEATSDFDIQEADSGSEVFALDEDDVDQNAATAMSSAPVFEAESESSDSDAAAPSTPSGAAWGAPGARTRGPLPRRPPGPPLPSSVPVRGPTGARPGSSSSA